MSFPESVPSAVARDPRAVLSRRHALLGVAALAVAGCAAPFGREEASGAVDAPHWDYDAEGPAHWADIDQRYLTCSRGGAQSPVDLDGHSEVDSADHIAVSYGPLDGLELINNGHTIQVNVPAGSGSHLVSDGRVHTLKQFHFHAPSEHTVDGATTAMELHLVHADERGALAVLAVLLAVGGDRSVFAPVLTDLPASGATRPLGPLDPNTLLPADRAQYRYAGSLTTPPCTEGVAWTVLRTPVQVTAAEVDRYRALFPHTNRPTQPLNGRHVALAGG